MYELRIVYAKIEETSGSVNKKEIDVHRNFRCRMVFWLGFMTCVCCASKNCVEHLNCA